MDPIVVVNGLYNPPLTKPNQGGQPEVFARLVPKLHLLQSKYTEHTLTYVFRKCVLKNLYLEKLDQTWSVFG